MELDLASAGVLRVYQLGGDVHRVCKAGYYKAMNESGSCEACPAGTYMNMTGGTACLVCPADTPFSAPGAAGCLEDDLFRQCFSHTFSLEGMQRV